MNAVDTDTSEDEGRIHWHKTGTFLAHGREFKTGTLGACTYLLSEKGDKLTGGFHNFRPLNYFAADGNTYILAYAGGICDILEVAPDGSIRNISDMIEGTDSLREDDNEWQPDYRGDYRNFERVPGRFHMVSIRGGKLLGELGAGEWLITPGTWDVARERGYFHDSHAHPERAGSGIGGFMTLLVILGMVYYLLTQ